MSKLRRWRTRRELRRRVKRGLQDWREGRMTVFETGAFLRTLTELVEQQVEGWEDWPPDVEDRLREWNANYLLSFRQGPDFKCGGGCGRMIKSHHRGNPVVRPTKKAHGVTVCEDCLVAFARKFDTPPWLDPHAAYQKLKHKFARQTQILEGTKQKNARLKQQVRIGEAYIDRLEAAMPDILVDQIKDELRGKMRRPQ